MKEHQAHQTEHVAALKEFYAVLTPDQKKVFDDFHSGPRNGGRGKSKHPAAEPSKAPQ
jgi:Spy/CpxP family protein refolding chaperone